MNVVLRPAQDGDFEFAFEAKKDALGPHVIAKWGWDDDFQRQVHRQRWAEKPWQILLLDGRTIGTISVDWRPTHMQFGEFYLLSEFRARGIGTTILKGVLSEVDRKRVETRLEYLKWNPVGSLYQRHGFRITSENEIHFYASRNPLIV